jgi:hypothetical protein
MVLDMKRQILLVCLVFTAGCPDEFGQPLDLTVRDFSPGQAAQDLSSSTIGGGEPDLAVAPDLSALAPGDMSVTPPDLAAPGLTMDQAADDLTAIDLTAIDLTAIDLTPAIDLAPIACDPDAGSGAPSRLYLAAIGAQGALVTAQFDVATGWSALATDSQRSLGELSLAVGPGASPLVVARLSDAPPTLAAATVAPCADKLSSPAPLFAGAYTSRRPALVGGPAADVVFRGGVNGDARLYHTHFDGSWSAAARQDDFFTDLAPSVVRVGGGLHALFTGQDHKLYDGTIVDSGTGGTATEVTGATSALSPAAVVATDGTTCVVFTGMDTNLYEVARAPGGAYGAAKKLCPSNACLAQSDFEPQLALTASGLPMVAFHGTDQKIYASVRAANGAWSMPTQATSGLETTDFSAALASGLGGADAELVYVRKSDGALRHARLTNGTFSLQPPLAGVVAQAAPALATSR